MQEDFRTRNYIFFSNAQLSMNNKEVPPMFYET